MADIAPHFVPVPGVVVERSRLVTIRYMVYCVFVAAFGGLMVFAWWNSRFGEGPNRASVVERYGHVLGAVIIVGSIIYARWLLSALRKKQRIVISDDRYQVIEHLDGTDTVVVEIPYGNLAEVKRHRTAHGVQVEIRVRNPTAPGTLYPAEHEPISRTGSADSFLIMNGFKWRPFRIADELEKAIGQWRATQTDADATG